MLMNTLHSEKAFPWGRFWIHQGRLAEQRAGGVFPAEDFKIAVDFGLIPAYNGHTEKNARQREGERFAGRTVPVQGSEKGNEGVFGMFDNIGRKVKGLAETLCVLGIIASVIAGIAFAASNQPLQGLIYAAVGALLSWVGSFGLYALGQLVENSDRQTELLERLCPEDTADTATGENAAKTHANDTADAADPQREIVTFGHYPQTKDGSDATPIEWYVLERDGSKALVISRFGLDAKPYHNKSFGKTTWEACSLRGWLNDAFINAAFTREEQAAVLSSRIDNSAAQGNSKWSGKGSRDTEDRVFLLSCAEVERYFDSAKARICRPTEYAAANGAFAAQGDGWWWLRSPGFIQLFVARVSEDGSIYSDFADCASGCVRPALWVNLESDLFRS